MDLYARKKLAEEMSNDPLPPVPKRGYFSENWGFCACGKKTIHLTGTCMPCRKAQGWKQDRGKLKKDPRVKKVKVGDE